MKNTIALLCLLAVFACDRLSNKATNSWCAENPRSGYENYKEIKTNYPWYKVYSVQDSVIAIYEPYNWQEVISYLIIGSDKALLFDTGMGLDSIQAVVKQLTSLPVTVVNSHTHFDHIGGNADFDFILGVDTAYTVTNTGGWSHESVRKEVSPAGLCTDNLSNVDTSVYHIRPYKLSGFIHDGSMIDLGNRKIEIMIIPGHTPDCVALFDREAGLLFTGDTYYEGPLWLFFPGTDLDAFEHSITRLAALGDQVKHLLPAHNLPVITPSRLVEVKEALAEIRSGNKTPEKQTQAPIADGVLRFKYEHFSFLISGDLLQP